jgi:hypothetical protein
LNTSVQATIGVAVELPPNAKAAVCVPAPAKPFLPVIIALLEDQDDPLYTSVQVHRGPEAPPPNAKAAVCVPAPAKPFLAVIIAPPAVQDVPL